jgi:hypothetical protein
VDVADIFARSGLSDPEPKLGAHDVAAIFGTRGVRRDVRASARLAGSLSPTENRRATARARVRLGGYGPEPASNRVVSAADPLGVGGLLEPAGLRSHVISRPRRRFVPA